MGQQLIFAHEAIERMRIAVLGTSGHAFRNYFPVLPYAPVEYVAQWDPMVERARAFARQFGAGNAAYDNLDRLLREQQPAAVLIATDDLDSAGRSIHPALMDQCLDAGCHVFCDKPAASTADEVRHLISSRDRVGKVVAVGIKTMHYPTHTRVHEIVEDAPAGFGRLVSLFVRYPLRVPARAGLALADPMRRSCLGHVWHPIGAAIRIGGPLHSLSMTLDHTTRNSVVTATFRGGAVAVFHFPTTASQASPLEYLEAVGEGANVIVDNAARITYYRKTARGEYGRTTDALTPLSEGPLRWEPEFSLGVLYNDRNFIQGYAQSVLHFTEAAMTGRPTTIGTLEDALEVLKVHEALCKGPGTTVTIPEG